MFPNASAVHVDVFSHHQRKRNLREQTFLGKLVQVVLPITRPAVTINEPRPREVQTITPTRRHGVPGQSASNP